MVGSGLAHLCHLLVVRRGEIEVDAAERAVFFRLAEDDGDLLVQGDAVTQAGSAIDVGFDSFLHQRIERRLAVLRRLINADDILVVIAQCFSDLALERFNRQIHSQVIRCSNFISMTELGYSKYPSILGGGGFGVGAFAKDGGANPDQGGTFFDGHRKITAHAHAQDGQGSAELLFTALF